MLDYRRVIPAMRQLLLFTVLCLLPGWSSGAAAPNIVVILADDLGWTDAGCLGSGYYETPHIDRLAREGMRLTSHHHAANCTPTRAALLLGQYGPRSGMYTVGSTARFDWSDQPLRPVDNVTELPAGVDLLPEQLRRAGYATGMFGKWGLGKAAESHPLVRGFSEAVVTSGGHWSFTSDPPLPRTERRYLADVLTDQAVSFLQRHRERPFFLYLSHYAVHGPHEAKPELVARFRGKKPVGGHRDPVYAAMIASLDESVGRVLATLDQLAIAERTIVIFTSDNGGVGGYRRDGLTGGRDVTDNAPLRNGKGSYYEGGIRVPFIVRWPGVVSAGSVSGENTIHVDLYPTLLEAARAHPPRQSLDGESLVGIWRDPAAILPREAIFHHFPGYLGFGHGEWRSRPVSAIHSGDWKLLEFLEDGRRELYNLRRDLGERHDLSQENPEMVQLLHRRLVQWRAQVDAPMPWVNRWSSPRRSP